MCYWGGWYRAVQKSVRFDSSLLHAVLGITRKEGEDGFDEGAVVCDNSNKHQYFLVKKDGEKGFGPEKGKSKPESVSEVHR